MEALVLASVLFATVAAGLTAYGASRWAFAAKTLLGRIEAARLPASTDRYTEHELEGLPLPVQRYFRTALTEGQAFITAVRVEHTGMFNLSTSAEHWAAFTSRQRV